MNLTSSAFVDGDTIPGKYTCDGEDISPPLGWDNVPVNTICFVLINDDPDAPMGTWDHWILFNMDKKMNGLPENADISTIPGALAGRNSWGRNGYGGPCPPSGTHRYFYKLYALDSKLDLQEGSSKQEIEKAMEGRILSKAELMGKYERK